MADVTCPLTFEDHAALVSETSVLSPELKAILKDEMRTTKIDHGYHAGYETKLTETETRTLWAYAKDHGMRTLVAALELALRGVTREKREGGKP